MRSTTEIEYIYYNERDIEVPALIESITGFVSRIDSFVDVGGCYSYYTYSNKVRDILKGKVYDVIDPQNCVETAKIVDQYYVVDVREIGDISYSYVSCISTLEHVGVNPKLIKGYETEQIEVFKKLSKLAERYLFVSYPFGKPDVFLGEYSNITQKQIVKFIEILKSAGFSKIDTDFFFNEFPQGREKWVSITIDEASEIPIRKEKGVQCLCILEAIR